MQFLLDIIEKYRKRDTKGMSVEEYREYRRLQKIRRKAQIYFRVGLLGLCILIILLFIRACSHKDKNVEIKNDTIIKEAVALEEEESVEEIEEAEEIERIFFLDQLFKEDDVSNIYSENVISNYGIIVNNSSNQVVAVKNAHDRINPASMTKVMTILTAAKHMDMSKLDERIALSNEAVSYAYANDCSTSGFVEGETVTIRDLFYGTILPSGGDAAAQLAICTAGSVDDFILLMNEDLKAMGISDSTHFTNVIGIYGSDHYSTCYDMAVIMANALSDSFCREVLSTHVYYSTSTNVNPEGIILSNWFLRRIEDKDIPGTILGAKTGYVKEAGNCAVSSLVAENGDTYIVVTADSTSSWRCIYDQVDIYSTYCK